MTRLFIAFPLPDDFKRSLMESSAALRERRPGLRWVRPDEMHVTLAFLGDVDDEGVALAIRAVQSLRGRPFELAADGLLAFPRRGPASVVGVRVARGTRESAALARGLEDALERYGAEAGEPFRQRERRPYTPHITLARASYPGVVLTEEERSLPLSAFCRVSSIVVYRSILGRGGARHEPLAELKLG